MAKILPLICIGAAMALALVGVKAQDKPAEQPKKISKAKIVFKKNGEKPEVIEWNGEGEMPAEMRQRVKNIEEELKNEGLKIELEHLGDKSKGFFFNFDVEDTDTPNAPPKKPKRLIKILPSEDAIEIDTELKILDELPEDLKDVLGEVDIKIKSLDSTSRKRTRIIKFEIGEIKRRPREENSAEAPPTPPTPEAPIFQVFPNPNSGKFKLHYTAKERGNLEVVVRDLDGKVIFADSQKRFKGEYNQDLDLGLRPGVYMVQITHNGNTQVRRVKVE